ncbi:MAG: hypothetical protein ACHQU8_01870 [Gemmatimonadales bacterium]
MRAGCAHVALLTLLTLLPLFAAVPAAHAQSSDEAQLVFTIYGGLSEGSDLWKIPAQAVSAPNFQHDTLSLARLLRPGLVTGLVTTYYASRHWGWTADVAFFGIGSEQRCTGPAAWQSDPQRENEQVCNTANGAHVSTYVVGLLGGVTYRPTAPDAPVQPFVRVTGGPGLLGNSSFIETVGVFQDTATCVLGCEESIVQNPSKPDITWVLNLAVGMSVSLAPGYRARMEFRDVITQLSVATGPRDPNNPAAEPPMTTIVRHLPTFLIGLDVVLERRHPRRY